MAYWGVAEAVGPNYNDPASDERFAAAHAAIQKAVFSGAALIVVPRILRAARAPRENLKNS